MFFRFDGEMRKIFNEDIDKHNILAWIIYSTNHQKQEYNGLKKYQCYISSSAVSKGAGVQLTKVKRLLKTLEDEGFISYVYKSKSKHTSSIIYADFIAKNDEKSEPVNEPVSEPVNEPVNEPVQPVENTKIHEHSEPVNEPVNEPVSEPVSEPLSINISKNISKNISNIYIEQNEFAHDSVEEQTFNDNVISLEANKNNRHNKHLAECDLLWSKYPKKKGKAKAYEKIPKLLKKHSLEELVRCVDRYLKEIQMQGIEKQFIKQGDTFFNSGYVDYLDENYEEPIKQGDNNTEQVGKFIPHYKVGVRVHETFRQYEPDELERLLFESQKDKFN